MSRSRAEFSKHQYPKSVSSELRGQLWNDERSRVSRNTASDPSWWTDNINNEVFSDDFVINQVPHESQICLMDVSREISCSDKVGSTSAKAPFQKIFEPSVLRKDSVWFRNEVYTNANFEWEAVPVCSDGSDYKTTRNSTLLSQQSWDARIPSKTQHFDCGSFKQISRTSASFQREISHPEPNQNHKRQIPRLDSFKCPHCYRTLFSERQIKSHVDKCKEQIQRSFKCDVCGQEFTRPQDVRRHQESSYCLDRPAPNRLWVCTCGKDYPRKDRCLRHIQRASINSGVTHALQSRLT